MTSREDMLAVARDAELDGRWDVAMTIRLETADAHPQPIAIETCGESPWRRGEWHGELISLDGCSAADFGEADVARVLGYGDCGGDWDGDAAGIILLRDGRYVVWESSWGPTGSGFSADAYGGTADIAFASTAGRALEYLSERSRELIRWA